MMRSSAYNRFGVLMGTSWPASCPRWYGLREDSLPMITLFPSQGDFYATAFGASTGMWHGQVEALQQSYRLIPWDMRGHGESDSPEAQALYSHQHIVEDMHALLEHLHIEQA